MLSVALRPPRMIREIIDPFSLDLIQLWKDRNLQGKIYTLVDIPSYKVMSYIMVEENGSTCTIRGLYTVPEFRRQGHAEHLLEYICNVYDGEGRSAIVVNVTDGAEHLYEKFDFMSIGRRKDFPDQTIYYRGTLTEEQLESYKKKVL